MDRVDSDTETRILNALGVGISQAKSSKWFKNNLGISRRVLCAAIESLRLKGIAIGADRSAKGGYYLMESDDEKMATINQYDSQIKKMLVIRNQLSKTLVGATQINLFKEDN